MAGPRDKELKNYANPDFEEPATGRNPPPKNPHEDPFVRNPFAKQRKDQGLPEDTPHNLKARQADVDKAAEKASWAAWDKAHKEQKAKYEAEALRLQKREFLINFVLARASTQPDFLDGEVAAEEAMEAWNAVVRVTEPPK